VSEGALGNNYCGFYTGSSVFFTSVEVGQDTAFGSCMRTPEVVAEDAGVALVPNRR